MNTSHDVLPSVRSFAQRELLGQQDYLDGFEEAPLPLYKSFHDQGLANWWLPEAYGGSGISLEDSVDIVSELAYGDAGAAFTLFISILGTSMVQLYGSEELRERYLTALAGNGGFCATLGSERVAGSELAKISTTISRDGDELVIEGEKYFSTNTGFADFLIVVGRSAENPGEFLAVLVPRDTPGVRELKRWEMIGLRASGTYEVALEGCRVPAANALHGPGLRLLEVALNASRILIATTAIGVSRRVRDLCMEYAEAKPLYDGYLVDNPVFMNSLGDMETRIEVMKSQCRAAAREFDAIMAGTDAASTFVRQGTLRSALAAKMYCGRAGWQIASEGSEMFGGHGFTREHVIGKLLRDVRYVSIVEGGDAVLRELMFNRYVLPEPRRG
ncbi:acyl-CoA dehydrogenase family protein [Streptomyces sp. WMMC1477]|uniref:acyl-CoA dehydrogenase family protein n=1 Tax=Streptomyces sp. WMMC1477 TaxID=3015155 RepID=UPI0022B73908|nr:acyl-CoA dehydrogenase family protein [Streptomyces sp. WMMC1477]MCZ7431113.1 acyl-CoA/acyl-ACP dehydrogenase [Streptomyces sp. WMMC1477]